MPKEGTAPRGTARHGTARLSLLCCARWSDGSDIAAQVLSYYFSLSLQ